MSKRADAAYRLACRLRRCLEDLAERVPDPLTRFADSLGPSCRAVDYTLYRLSPAHAAGWMSAAARLRQDLLAQLHGLCDCGRAALAAVAAVRPADAQAAAIASVPEILADLRQLGHEFPRVEFDLRGGRIRATTEPIVVAGVPLGRFAIELHLSRLAAGAGGADGFRCVALDPNPAACNGAVTHPHVKADGLCAGDAATPLAEALRAGRVCDAFCLVSAVLHTYSPLSPYVDLEEWDGTPCPDCGRASLREQMTLCRACGRHACERCAGRCDVCDGGCCRCCLESDPTTGRACCPSCRERCGGCGRAADPEALDAQTRLCPRCLAWRRENPSDSDAAEPPEPPARGLQ